jgi:hypothetical protein
MDVARNWIVRRGERLRGRGRVLEALSAERIADGIVGCLAKPIVQMP